MSTVRKMAVIAMLLCSWVSVFASNIHEPSEPDCMCPTVTGLNVTSSITTMTVSWTTSAVFMEYIVDVSRDAAFNQIFFSSTTTGGSVTFNGTSPGPVQYWVRVKGICNDQQYSNAFATTTHTAMKATSDCSPDGGEDVDVSDIYNFAQLLGASYSEKISTPTDIDWYKVYVDCPGNRVFTLTNMINDYELELLTYTVPPAVIASSINPGTANESISHNFTNPGYYFLKVRPFQGAHNTYNCYLLTHYAPCLTGGGGGENLVTGGQGGGLGTKLNELSNSLELDFGTPFEADRTTDVQIYAAQGQLISSESVLVLKGESKISLDLPDLASGVYFVHATGAFGQKSAKIVVAQ